MPKMNRYKIVWRPKKKSLKIEPWARENIPYEKYLSFAHTHPSNHWILIHNNFVTLQTCLSDFKIQQLTIYPK